MFDMALKVVPINGIQDLWIHVSNKLLLWEVHIIMGGISVGGISLEAGRLGISVGGISILNGSYHNENII